MKNALIIQIRNPISQADGPPILRVFDEEQMRRLKAAFVEDTLYALAPLIDEMRIVVVVAPPSRARWVEAALESLSTRFPGEDVFVRLQKGIEVQTQPVAPLSERTAANIQRLCQNGSERVVLVGGYNPTINPDIIRHAFDRLEDDRIVLGPTIEGGCYLFGVHSSRSEDSVYFDAGNDQAYRETARRLEEAGHSFAELELWYDVAHQEDLEFVIRDINQFRLVGDEESALRTEELLTLFSEAASHDG